jgi:hypothetical protein
LLLISDIINEKFNVRAKNHLVGKYKWEK